MPIFSAVGAYRTSLNPGYRPPEPWKSFLPRGAAESSKGTGSRIRPERRPDHPQTEAIDADVAVEGSPNGATVGASLVSFDQEAVL